MRAFIAIDLPPQCLTPIHQLMTQLKALIPPTALRWTDPQQLHLTLKFLGEISETTAIDVQNGMQATLTSQPPFDLEIKGTGVFPSRRAASVVWLGVTASPDLMQLHEQLNQALHAVGIKPDKKHFNPHITLGRVRRPVDTKTRLWIGDVVDRFSSETFAQFLVQAVHVYQSELTPQGAFHTKLSTVLLDKV